MRKKICRFIPMRKKGFQIVLWPAAIFMLGACSKDSSGTDESSNHLFSANDKTPPEIIVFTPSANQVFSNANVINISGRITDDLGLYRGTIKIVNDANSSTVMSQAFEIHGLRLYNFNINHTTSVSTASDYSVVITFEDHGTNSATKSVPVKVNP